MPEFGNGGPAQVLAGNRWARPTGLHIIHGRHPGEKREWLNPAYDRVITLPGEVGPWPCLGKIDQT